MQIRLFPRTDTYNSFVLIRRLLTEYGLVRWRHYTLVFALMGVAALCTGLAAYLMGDVVNRAFDGREFGAVVQIGVMAFGVFTLRGLALYGQAVMLSRIGNSIIAENQLRMYSKLLQHNLSFFAERHSSELLTRFSTGALAATQALNLLVGALGRDLLTLISLVAVMAVQDPVMSLVVFVIGPPIVIFVKKLTRRMRAVAHGEWSGGVHSLFTLQETLQGVRIVKAFTLEPTMRSRFTTNVADLERASNKMARVGQRINPLMETLGGLAVTFGMIYAGYRVIHTGAASGEFMSFMAAFLLAYEPAKRLARFNIDLTQALFNVRILFEIIDGQATEPSDDERPGLVATSDRVEFSRVSFGYPGGRSVFRHLSFVAESQKVTALVGASGAGKSTIFNLILRFYEIDGGAITIDGQNIGAVSRTSVRQQIAYVGQDVFLFHASIRDNIRLGRLAASDAEIMAAAKAAHADDFIMRFSAGYDTPVGEHGLKLSGGERQRIAIARALIKNAPIILLDEATAALDSESEYHVQQAISELCKGRTTLVIAHRLSTIMHADRILVLEAGEVVESGKHDELLRAGGRYALFYNLQLRRQEPSIGPEANAGKSATSQSIVHATLH